MEATHEGLDVKRCRSSGSASARPSQWPADLDPLDRAARCPPAQRPPLACRTRVHLADLAGLPWITTAAQDPVWQTHAQPTGGRDEPGASVVAETLDEFLEAVTAGREVGLAPASASRLYARPGVAFIEVADAEPSVAALAWRREAPDANPLSPSSSGQHACSSTASHEGNGPSRQPDKGRACTADPKLAPAPTRFHQQLSPAAAQPCAAAIAPRTAVCSGP
jgi:hypothetical protein